MREYGFSLTRILLYKDKIYYKDKNTKSHSCMFYVVCSSILHYTIPMSDFSTKYFEIVNVCCTKRCLSFSKLLLNLLLLRLKVQLGKKSCEKMYFKLFSSINNEPNNFLKIWVIVLPPLCCSFTWTLHSVSALNLCRVIGLEILVKKNF